MNDTRIRQIIALLDDARCLSSEIEEEGPEEERDFNILRAGHQFTNSAITCYQQLETTP